MQNLFMGTILCNTDKQTPDATCGINSVKCVWCTLLKLLMTQGLYIFCIQFLCLTLFYLFFGYSAV